MEVKTKVRPVKVEYKCDEEKCPGHVHSEKGKHMCDTCGKEYMFIEGTEYPCLVLEEIKEEEVCV